MSVLSDYAIEKVRQYIKSPHNLGVEEVSPDAQVWPSRYFKLKGESLAKLIAMQDEKAQFPARAQALADEFGAIRYDDFGGREVRLVFEGGKAPKGWEETTSWAKEGPTCCPDHEDKALSQRVKEITALLHPESRFAKWTGWESVSAQGMATKVPGQYGYGSAAGIKLRQIGESWYAEITPVQVYLYSREQGRHTDVEGYAVTYPIPPEAEQLSAADWFKLLEDRKIITPARTGTIGPTV